MTLYCNCFFANFWSSNKYKISGLQTAGNERPILLNIMGIITNAKAGIQAAVRSKAAPPLASKNPVLDFMEPDQVWKLEK